MTPSPSRPPPGQMPDSRAEADDKTYVEWLDDVWGRRLVRRAGPREALSIGILLWPGFPLMSLTGIVESLRHAGDFGDRSRQIEGRWELLGNPDVPVRSSCGIEVRPTSLYPHPGEFDYVFVIGGLLSQLAEAPSGHRRYIALAHQLGRIVVGVCTGSFVLAQERLLGRATACVHPYYRIDFELAFPNHRLTTDRDFVVADGVITVPGGISILALMAQIVAEKLGADRRAKVVHQLSLPERRGIGDFERAGLTRHAEIRNPRVQKAIAMIESGRHSELGVADIARSLGISERHFLRIFRQETGVSPREYVLQARLRIAVWLLRHTTNSITSVAYDAGCSTPADLSVLCMKRLGQTPTEVRRQARTKEFGTELTEEAEILSQPPS